jgi:long-chain acyl-CoA synthetase
MESIAVKLNLYDQFHETAQRQPANPAIFDARNGAVLSYAALDDAIVATSDRLRSIGVAAGDCVGLHYPGSTQYIIYTYATWRCGGCVVPLPVELADAEKSEICRCIALDYVVSAKPAAGFLQPFCQAAPCNLAADAIIARVASGRQHPAGFQAINSAFIRFTSGTTGASKGVVLSHESIDERIHAANEVLKIGQRDRVLWVLSMSYHFTVSIVAYLALGAAIVLPANHFAAAIVDAMHQYKATMLYASPMHYALLADYARSAPIASLRLAISTTSSLAGPVAARFCERYARPISQALGIIEVGLPCIHVDARVERWDSVGRVLPAYRLRLEDNELEPDLKEVLLNGPGFLDAYYDPFQTRHEIMPDGWFRTGDVGRLDDDGYLFLKGRSTDVINVMGMKFFPHEVEAILSSHPCVEAASVFGGPAGRWGEKVQARIVAKNGCSHADLERQLRLYCHERLATYKIPEQIEFVRALPQTASGKVLHRAI